MCQCGCSEFYRRFKLTGPDGFWCVIDQVQILEREILAARKAGG